MRRKMFENKVGIQRRAVLAARGRSKARSAFSGGQQVTHGKPFSIPISVLQYCQGQTSLNAVLGDDTGLFLQVPRLLPQGDLDLWSVRDLREKLGMNERFRKSNTSVFRCYDLRRKTCIGCNLHVPVPLLSGLSRSCAGLLLSGPDPACMCSSRPSLVNASLRLLSSGL